MANKFKLNLFVFINQRNQNDVGKIYFLTTYKILYIKTTLVIVICLSNFFKKSI